MKDMRANILIIHNVVGELCSRVLTIMCVLIALATTNAAIAQENADIEQSFTQLAKPEGEAWRIAESDILREWSKSGSASLDLLLKRGEDALDEGDPQSAIGHLTALTDQAPEFAAGWYARSSAFAATGHFGPAFDDLAKTLKLEPRHFAALTQLGVLFEEIGNPEKALEAYRESLKIHPHQQEAIDGVARLEREQTGIKI